MLNSIRKLHGKLHDKLFAKSDFDNMYNYVVGMQNCSGLRVMDINDTLSELEKGKSMARFGDGEMELIKGNSIGFQKANERLAKRLTQVLLSNHDENCMICVPDALVNFDNITDQSLDHWVRNMFVHYSDWQQYLSTEQIYGTTNVTRCYMRYKDKSNCLDWFQRLKKTWSDSKVILVEGEKSRIGIGNDMLDNASSVVRVLCPAENAFDKYDEIFNYVLSIADQHDIVLLALGPTATILAYDLSHKGIRALDIGHCDVEYSWCKLGVTKKVALTGKYVNNDEVDGGANFIKDVDDQNYQLQIIRKIL